MTAQRARLGDGRLHLNHGPIDLIIEAFGEKAEIEAAYEQAWARFPSILPELTRELPILRRPMGEAMPALAGPVARRMAEAVWPFRRRFITPMAAVAGAVAEEMLAALIAGRRLAKAYVNDGGDIALHLGPGERFTAGIVAELEAPAIAGQAEIAASDAVRGIATSGRGGRSFSLGIADAVTVLAASAAAADAAATMIANAVDLDHPAIARRPAASLDPDSDLGDLPVTVGVGALSPDDVAAALDAGRARALEYARAGLILAAMLQLCGERRIVSADGYSHPQVSFHP
ncbi:MAG TPA: UPF0280 family protein [Dongiaceae bacterium]|nr:UPF0280 family protein [Dongiaceae bacterium]